MNKGGSGNRVKDVDLLMKEISELEDAAVEAIVPGESLSWSHRVKAALERFAEVWVAVSSDHRQIYQTILETDDELAARVESLREREKVLAGSFSDIETRLGDLIVDEQKLAGSEEPVGEIEEIREELLDLIAHTKAHHKEVTTWFLEAFYRDRGIRD